MKLKTFSISLALTLALLMPVGFSGVHKAEAFLGDIIGGVLGGGGEPVRIVSDTSETTIANTIKTALLELSNAFIGGEISSLNLKETVLDPIAWNMAKQLQQQLTGDLLKWLGGQMPGQEGQVPFIQNYSDYWTELLNGVYGNYVDGGRLSGLCSEEEDFLVKKEVYNSYTKSLPDRGQMFRCVSEELESSATAQKGELDNMFKSFANCSDVTCASFKAKYQLALEQANAFANEDKITNLTGGMRPQRLCRPTTDADGNPGRPQCGLVNPPFLAEETVREQLVRLPAQQLLQVDEFNEMVSNLMSNLTNQALQGLTGVLGLSGNPDFSSSIFGPDGALSYVDALLQDDIADYQASTGSPIKEALSVEQQYNNMQTFILSEIQAIESELVAGSCATTTLSAELLEAKTRAADEQFVSNALISILTTLDNQYDDATDASGRGQAMSGFVSLKSGTTLRTSYDLQRFQVEYLDVTFAQMVDRFRFENQSCITYDGVLAETGTDDGTGTGGGEGE